MAFDLWIPRSRTNEDVDEICLPYYIRESDVVAVYRVGSRFDGTARTDSDMDYMLMRESDNPIGDCWVSASKSPTLDMWIETISFSRGDLQNPDTLEDRKRKVAFLYEKYRGRKLLYGSDVFEQWLSPEIERLFESMGLTPEVAKKILKTPIPEL